MPVASTFCLVLGSSLARPREIFTLEIDVAHDDASIPTQAQRDATRSLLIRELIALLSNTTNFKKARKS
jgi:hypothetical protein